MNNHNSLQIKPVHAGLFQRFYSDGKAVVEKQASSHWQKCSGYFAVKLIGGYDFELSGYGFGTSSYKSLPAQLFAWGGNNIHLAFLKMPGLQQDIIDAKKVISRMGLKFSQDAFRQVCTFNLLNRKMQIMQAPNRILIIGDGHGILSALLHARYPNARIYLVDLGSVLFFQAYHLHKAFPEVPQSITDEGSDKAMFNFCPADSLDTLPREGFCLAINVASMQEMDPAVIADYFSAMRQSATRLFYCCNRLEKHLEGGVITHFMDYPWSAGDEHLIDEPCPWHQCWAQGHPLMSGFMDFPFLSHTFMTALIGIV